MDSNMWNLPVPGSTLVPSQTILDDDFTSYSGSATADASRWFETVGTGGAVASADDEVGGAVVLTAGTAGETGIEPNGAAFAASSQKDIYLAARFKMSDIDDAEVFVGLATPSDVSPAAGATDRVGFLVNGGGDASIDYVIDATETDSGLDVPAADTYITVAVQIEGTKKIRYWIDLEQGAGPQLVATVTSGQPTEGTALMPKFYVGTSTGSDTISLDRLLCIQKR